MPLRSVVSRRFSSRPPIARLRIHVGAVNLDDALLVVAARHARLEIGRRAVGREIAGEKLAQPGTVVECNQVVQLLADQVLRREAEDALGGRRHIADPAVRCDDGDDIRGIADERVESRFGRTRGKSGLDGNREHGRECLAREQQPRRDADDPGDETGRLAETAGMQHQERIARKHQRRIRHEWREWRSALGGIYRRRAPLGAQVIEMCGDRERRDRRRYEAGPQTGKRRRPLPPGLRAGVRQARSRVPVRIRRAPASPASPSGGATDRGEHADDCVESHGPGTAGGQRIRRQVVRHRKPQHGADAERDQRRLEPELGTEGSSARRDQQSHGSHRGTGEECELQQARREMHSGYVEGARRRHGECGGKQGAERERKPTPGAATFRLQLTESCGAPYHGDGSESRRDSGQECGGPVAGLARHEYGDRRDNGESDAKQHEPGRRMVKPWRQGCAQPMTGRLITVQLHRALLPSPKRLDGSAGGPENQFDGDLIWRDRTPSTSHKAGEFAGSRSPRRLV